MPTTPLQGPLVRNLSLSPVDGYLPAARGLNTYILAQNSYAVGGLATSGTSANPVVMTQPAITQLVINTGTSIKALIVNATTVTLPTVGSPQDVYVDVDNTGSYSTHGGAVGFTPPAVAANALRLYMVRTNTGGVGVNFITPLAATGPFNPPLSSVMNTAGTNAAAVALPNALNVAGITDLGNLTINGATNNIFAENGGVLVSGYQPSVSVSMGFAPAMTITGLAANNVTRGRIAFSIASMSLVTGVQINMQIPGPPYPDVVYGIARGVDGPSAKLAIFCAAALGSVIVFEVWNYTLMVAGTTYTFCYRTYGRT